MSDRVAQPDWQVTLDGRDLTGAMRPYLIRMRVSQRREEEADELEIELDDSGRSDRLELPAPGACLSIAMGWRRAPTGAATGLIEMGSFVVDEIEHANPPARIRLRARSANFTAALRQKRDAKWEARTLATILKEIAGRHNLATRIDGALGAVSPALVTQSRESDAALIMRLGKEHHAVATIKAGCLLFLPLAGGRTADGRALPAVTVRSSEGDGHSFRILKREDYSGVSARWHDRKAAEQKTVKVKGEESVDRAETSVVAGDVDNAKVLSKVYPTEVEARRAAEAEWARIKRAPRSLDLRLAYGRVDIGAGQPLVATGYREEIDAEDWLVAAVDHQLDGSGLTTSLSCEVAASM